MPDVGSLLAVELIKLLELPLTLPSVLVVMGGDVLALPPVVPSKVVRTIGTTAVLELPLPTKAVATPATRPIFVDEVVVEPNSLSKTISPAVPDMIVSVPLAIVSKSPE